MCPRVRFFGAGVSVLALCLLLACLSWPFLLGFFVALGIGTGLWSYLAECEKEHQLKRSQRALRNSQSQQQLIQEELAVSSQSTRRRRRRRQAHNVPESTIRSASNVYPFPTQDKLEQDLLSRTEVAE